MSAPTVDVSGCPDDPTALDEVSLRALEIYERDLKPQLEPEHNGQALAIDIRSGDYTLARGRGAALRALRQMHPDAEIVVMRVGPEPEYGLAARLMARRAPATTCK
jgi:hypothetical protein